MKRNKGNPFYDGGLDPLILIAKNLSNNFEKLYRFTSVSSEIQIAYYRLTEDLGTMFVMLCQIPSTKPAGDNKI